MYCQDWRMNQFVSVIRVNLVFHIFCIEIHCCFDSLVYAIQPTFVPCLSQQCYILTKCCNKHDFTWNLNTSVQNWVPLKSVLGGLTDVAFTLSVIYETKSNWVCNFHIILLWLTFQSDHSNSRFFWLADYKQ
jgi:hypothetical protein